LSRVHGRLFSRERAEYLRKKAAEDAAFDTAQGLDTGGVQHAYQTQTIGTAASAAISHIAIPPQEFDDAIDAIDIPLDEAVFIDLGSGKGRALILAAKRPFRRVIGVEFATSLHEIAERNFKALGVTPGADQRIELINDDATQFAFPAGPVVLFLYHPFGPPVMTRVAEAALADWRSGSRPMQIAYVNPIHLDEWLRIGWELKERTRTHAILNPPQDCPPRRHA
jgi:SAM-dependent methyltransferase